MAFTGRLGTADSQLSQIELGAAGQAGGAGSFTADAVLLRIQSSSFPVDAQITTGAATQSGSFTVDAVLTNISTVTQTFTIDAVLAQLKSSSFNVDATLRWSQSGSFTADGVLKKSSGTKTFTVDAVKRRPVSSSFAVDAYVRPPYVMQHWRTPSHTGFDHDIDHTLAHSFDHYTRGEILQQVLFDLDCRLTTLEESARRTVCRRVRFPIDAVIKGSEARSWTVDAEIALLGTGTFTIDARLAGIFTVDAVIAARGFTVDAVIASNLTQYNIQDLIANAEDWNIEAGPGFGHIPFSSLTHDASDPSSWFGSTWPSGWAKFVLTATHSVELTTDGTEGDAVYLYLFGPGTPTNGNNIDTQNNNASPNSFDGGYYSKITATLSAGTYYVAVAKSSATFEVYINTKVTA